MAVRSSVLLLIGFTMVIAGLLLVLFHSFELPRDSKFIGILLIGPIPIILDSSDPVASFGLISTFVGLIVLMVVLLRRAVAQPR